MALLGTRHLVKQFGGVRAVDHVDLQFRGGTITALLGPNGSGKTTFINAVTGITPPDGGSILVSDSVELTHIAPADIATYGITRTFQSVRLIEQISVLDNLLLVLTERNIWGALFEKHSQLHLDAAEDILKKVGLWEKRHEHAEHLSFGQRKLLEVARAVSMRATVYLFDEPFAGIFREKAKLIEQILLELKREGAAIVLVEHDMHIIRELADYCYVLDSGKVIAEGAPDQALAEKVVVDAYLGK